MADRPLPGTCAGKDAIASYLIEHHSFSRLTLCSTTVARESSLSYSVSNNTEETKVAYQNQSDHAFETTEELVEFVTSRWRQHWVTTDIENEASLECIIRRPFSLLVSIDAPIHIRWSRSTAR